jgi:PIN like domain
LIDKFTVPLLTPLEAADHLQIPQRTMHRWLHERAAGETPDAVAQQVSDPEWIEYGLARGWALLTQDERIRRQPGDARTATAPPRIDLLPQQRPTHRHRQGGSAASPAGRDT